MDEIDNFMGHLEKELKNTANVHTAVEEAVKGLREVRRSNKESDNDIVVNGTKKRGISVEK